MQVQRVNLSPMQLVSLTALKAHMRISTKTEDALIKDLQLAAYDWVEQFTGRSLLTTEWKFTTTSLKAGSEVRHALPFPSLLGIESVNHVFSNIKKEKTKKYTMEFRHGVEYICMLSMGVPIEIIYNAGFGPHPQFVPEAFHHAIKVLVALWFDEREGLGCCIPATIEAILRPYQIRRLA